MAVDWPSSYGGTFDKAFDLVVGLEGGYSNDSADSGGATRWGISKRSHPNLDITTLTIENAKEIYAEEYWNLAHCGDFPADLRRVFMRAEPL